MLSSLETSKPCRRAWGVSSQRAHIMQPPEAHTLWDTWPRHPQLQSAQPRAFAETQVTEKGDSAMGDSRLALWLLRSLEVSCPSAEGWGFEGRTQAVCLFVWLVFRVEPAKSLVWVKRGTTQMSGLLGDCPRKPSKAGKGTGSLCHPAG